MTDKVAVFGASGRIGQAQVRQLSLSGYQPIAVTRHPEALNHPDFAAVEIVPADFDQPTSIATVFARADAVFFQLPTMASPVDTQRYAHNFAYQAHKAGKRVIVNTTMWAPDDPPSEVAMYDVARTAEDILVDADLELVIFRPTIMMESLLTVLWKPSMVSQGVARYAQRPGLRANWISTDDIAKFMIEGLRRTDLNGQRIRIGGPEALTVEEVPSPTISDGPSATSTYRPASMASICSIPLPRSPVRQQFPACWVPARLTTQASTRSSTTSTTTRRFCRCRSTSTRCLRRFLSS